MKILFDHTQKPLKNFLFRGLEGFPESLSQKEQKEKPLEDTSDITVDIKEKAKLNEKEINEKFREVTNNLPPNQSLILAYNNDSDIPLQKKLEILKDYNENIAGKHPELVFENGELSVALQKPIDLSKTVVMETIKTTKTKYLDETGEMVKEVTVKNIEDVEYDELIFGDKDLLLPQIAEQQGGSEEKGFVWIIQNPREDVLTKINPSELLEDNIVLVEDPESGVTSWIRVPGPDGKDHYIEIETGEIVEFEPGLKILVPPEKNESASFEEVLALLEKIERTEKQYNELSQEKNTDGSTMQTINKLLEAATRNLKAMGPFHLTLEEIGMVETSLNETALNADRRFAKTAYEMVLDHSKITV